ncbi:MAG: ribonucleotide-diphosphate reductase subunit beta [Nitrosopumilaceae archaeon]|nr:ribonucleotide-diphosphate reductase subunit beta [Nitrosopumilaceae archaeon]NIT99458.1 ribonucleotide-diphosphate reductase subunit beta [Nitrosopumilaceae archaeon]NIU85817.1 ribonucleotide-diphosphate reductase subunit beta [Nitrosopumilaceae archaeon]NIV64674.1 ribonucleotide-diphosphate reductase subunit beta [Nitrosopumilaceae archaeon]NIX60061.1 ribonucleotide-diphosphate reductase subunit beta [Nitrosopumilaceae archaeon]
MYSIILTELGISIYDDKTFVRSFSFKDSVKDYLAVKERDFNDKSLIDFLNKQESSVLVNDSSLASILKKNSIDTQLMSEEEVENIQTTKPQILVESNLAKDIPDAMKQLRNFAMNLSSSKVTEVSQSPDLHIIQAINSLDEMDKIINSLSSRLREWYGLHFPELDNIVDSIQGYCQIVLAGKRQDMDKTTYEDAGFPESKIDMLSVAQDRSRGGEISQENLSIVQTMAKQIVDLYELRKILETHIESQMDSIAPNLSAILGTSVGARTLAKAGSLKKLASLPASTIQVLGAEKALFRSLKTGSQPPKHGLLFQHSLVHAAPRWQRGKIARAIAAKAAIASRVDVYGGGLNKTLLEKLNVRVDEIGKKYEKPTIKEKPQKRDKSRKKSKSKKSKSKKRKKFGKR